jgi:pimeloyl-ACP methyl ester carboxylesterase
LLGGEAQSFVFTPPGHFSDKPITVHYYKPANATAQSEVLIAIHGAERSASRARDNWIKAARRSSFIVLAPEFDAERFSERLFQLGGMERTDHADWTFQLIEDLFDKVRSEEGLSTGTYKLFGHSAGGQFVHRFVLMMPRPRLSAAVAANSGSYTWAAYPRSTHDIKFPFALDKRVTDQDQLKAAFGQNLVILLGEDDIHTVAANFPRSKVAMAEGATRLERGKNFCAGAQTQAQALALPLNWKCITVPNVGHDSARMSKAAAAILFDPAD